MIVEQLQPYAFIFTSPYFYGAIVTLTTMLFIQLFHQLKNKFVTLIFMVLIFILNVYLREQVYYESVLPVVYNTLLLLVFYVINTSNYSLQGTINIILCTVLPYTLAYGLYQYSGFYAPNMFFYISYFSGFFTHFDNEFKYAIDLISHLIFISSNYIVYYGYYLIKKEKLRFEINLLLIGCQFFLMFFQTYLLLNYYDYPPLMAIIILSYSLLILLSYQLYKDGKEKLKLEKKMLKEQLNKEKTNALYHESMNTMDRFVKLKHEVVSLIRKYKDNQEKVAVLEELDEIITPIIIIFSENKVLNSILLEKYLLTKNLGIYSSFMIINDIDFFNEEEITYLFGRMLDELLSLENLKEIKITAYNRTSSLYQINFVVDGNRNFNESAYWKTQFFKDIEDRYSASYIIIFEDDHTHIRILFNVGGTKNEEN